MKQKKIGDILYVFSTTAYQITEDTDVSIIKIQLEAMDAFAALNESLVSKFEPINYKLFCVVKPEWADYYDDLEIIITPTTNGTVTVSPASADMGEEVTITATPNEGYLLDSLVVMCGSTEVPVTDNKFTMPAGDVTVTGTFVQDVVPYDEQYFTIESLEDGNVLSIGANAGTSGSRYYSTDGGTTWSSFGPMASFNLDTGDKVMFKNTGNDFAVSGEGSFSDPIFGTTKTVNVYGNIMSLLYGDNFANQTSLPLPSTPNVYGNFMGLFFGSKVVDASNLILPATTLQEKCYHSMFYECTSLTTAPSLPATTLTQNCYTSMFHHCTSLTTAPALPATTLTQSCYNEMFQECTSLRSITMLATTLGDLSSNHALYNIVYHTYADGIPYEQKNGKMYVSSSLSTQQKDAINDRLVVNESYDYWTIVDYVPAS